MSNYALDTPIKKNLYVPPEDDDIPFAPVSSTTKQASETDQTHRHMTWLFHKSAEHVAFPYAEQTKKK